MRHVLTLIALLAGALALIGLTLWGLASLLLLLVSAVCLMIAWKLRPRGTVDTSIQERL